MLLTDVLFQLLYNIDYNTELTCFKGVCYIISVSRNRRRLQLLGNLSNHDCKRRQGKRALRNIN